MPSNISFQLKRQETILSSLVRYLSGHTTDVTDFSEGSITRSLLEGVSQEIYRQNITYAQGITTGLPASIRSAFNLPLLDAIRSSGRFTAYRQMLNAPSNVSLDYTEPTVTINGTISGLTLTVSSKTLGAAKTGMVVTGLGVRPGTYLDQYLGVAASPNLETWTIGPGASFSGTIVNNILTVVSVSFGSIATGMSINDATLSLGTCNVLYNLTGAGGVGTYYVSGSLNISSATNLFANPQNLTSRTFGLFGLYTPTKSLFAELAAGSGLNAATTYYYSTVPVYGDYSIGFIEGVASSPVNVFPNSTSSANITWNSPSGSSGIRLYRSTSSSMQNAEYIFLPNNVSLSVNTNGSNSHVYRNLYTESSFLGSGATFTWTATGGAVTAISVGSGGTNYSNGDVLRLLGYGNNNCVFVVSGVSAGVITSLTVMHPGSGYTTQTPTAVSATKIVYVPNKWPGTKITYAISSTNITNNATAETTPATVSIIPSGSLAGISWKSPSAIDSSCDPTGHKIYRALCDTSVSPPTGLSAQLNSTASSLNYGANITYAAAYQRTLIVSPSSTTSGGIIVGQQLSSSSGLVSNTSVSASLSGSSSTAQKWLLNLPQTSSSTGTGATVTWTASSGNVLSITVVNGGSGYAVGDVILLNGYGNSDAFFRVNGAAGLSGTALVTGTYTATSAGTSGSGAKFTWQASLGSITSIRATVGGSNYAVGDIIIVSTNGTASYGNGLTYIKILTALALDNGSIRTTIDFTTSTEDIRIFSNGGAAYSTQTSETLLINPLTIQLISSGTSYSAQASAVSGTTGVSVNGLIGINSYTYAVSALLSGSETLLSNTFTISPNQFFPTVYLTWNEVVGAVGYRIYKSSSTNLSNSVFYDTVNNFFYDTGTLFNSNQVISSDLPIAKMIGTTAASVTGFSDAGVRGTNSSWLSTPSAFSKSGPIVIPAGTRVGSTNNAVTYRYVTNTAMSASSSSVTGVIQCEQYGQVGNVGAKVINTFLNPVYGIERGENLIALITGADVETEDEWKVRFSQSLQKNARGTADAITAGALGTRIYDDNGFILETVTKALLVEQSSANLYLYIHNGLSGGPSADLVSETQKIIDGYTLPNGQKIAGYKAAGIPVVVSSASTILQNISISVRLRPGMAMPVMQTNMFDKINKYFLSLDIGDGLYVPSITSVSSNSTSQNVEYRYQLVAIDSRGNKSAASAPFVITNGNSAVNNTITWSISSGGPTISSYDLLRWNGSGWGLAATISTSSSYYNSSTSQIIYTDTINVLSEYVFITYATKYLQKNDLINTLLTIPGILTLSVKLPNSAGADQEYVQPPLGNFVMPGVIYIN